ncbi:MAG: hypothetical protein ACQEVA_15900 [Myxococcota bacterium]
MRWKIAYVLAGSLLMASCVGTEVGNPQDENADVSVQFTGVEQPPPNALTLSSGVRIDEAWLVFSEASVELASQCDEDGEIDVEQPFAVELVGGSELPAPNMFTRPQGSYCRFELELDALDAADLPEDVPAELVNTSVLVRGARADGTPFELRSTTDESIAIEGDFAFDRTEESLLVAFALDRWFADAGLDALTATDPIVIDDEVNSTVLEIINESIPKSALLIRDENRDGAAQPSELAAPLADSAEDSEEPGS